MVKERYPEIKDLYKSAESQNEMRYLINSTCVKLSNGETLQKEKRVYVIPSVIDPDKGLEDKKIYEMMHHKGRSYERRREKFYICCSR